jgi:hypothetical protein
MKSKAYVRFLNRAVLFEADLELVDALSYLASQQAVGSGRIFPNVSPERHPRLANRRDTAVARRLACKHLNITLRAAYLKDIYEEIGHYMTDILTCAIRRGLDPSRIIGSHRFSVEASFLLTLGTWERVLDYVSNELFRKLENERSTIKLLTAFSDKLNLGVDNAIIEAALPYLDLRHILVHRDGRIDREFAARHPQLGLNEGDDFSLSHDQIVRARTAILALVQHYDEKVISTASILPEDQQP